MVNLNLNLLAIYREKVGVEFTQNCSIPFGHRFVIFSKYLANPAIFPSFLPYKY